MAIVTKNRAKKLQQFGGVPYGNQTKLHFNMTLNAAGALADSDQATAVIVDDVLRLGVLPKGMKLADAAMIVSNVGQAATTLKVGFEYVDGVDVTAVPEDDDYFFAATATDALGLTRKTVGTAPVVLPKDAYLIATNEGAVHDEACVVDIFIDGELMGPA